jgi:uncharacterized protein (TIGR03435 family)
MLSIRIGPGCTAAISTAVLVLVTVSAGANSAQQTAGAARPAFEAASIKLAAPGATPNGIVQTSPNRLLIRSMTLTWLVYTAYGDGGFNTSMRVTGGPDWVNKTVFAVEGVAAGAATASQLRLMLRTLLEDRFALKLRRDAPIGDVLALVVDRPDGTLGPKVKPWSGTCPGAMPALYFQAPRRPLVNAPPLETVESSMAYCPTGYRAGGITVDGATMSIVAELLSLPPARALLGTITQDRTGLTGRYAMELDYPFPTGVGTSAATPEFGAPALSTAVLEQWGLRLVPSRGPLRTFVVESAQPPTAN